MHRPRLVYCWGKWSRKFPKATGQWQQRKELHLKYLNGIEKVLNVKFLNFTHRRKIPFGLEGKDCQRESDDSCYSNCNQNLHDLKICRYNSKHQRLRHCERKQKNKINWRFPSQSFATCQCNQSYKQNNNCSDPQPPIWNDPLLRWLVKHEKANDSQSNQKLHLK